MARPSSLLAALILALAAGACDASLPEDEGLADNFGKAKKTVIYTHRDLAATGEFYEGGTQVTASTADRLEVSGPLVVLSPGLGESVTVELEGPGGGDRDPEHTFFFFVREPGQAWQQIEASELTSTTETAFTTVYASSPGGILGVRIDKRVYTATERYPWADATKLLEYGVFVVPDPAGGAFDASKPEPWRLTFACGPDDAC
jgi:hypothetical protein